jgi:hypothetical protein
VLRAEKQKAAVLNWRPVHVGQSHTEARPVSPDLLRSDHAAPGTNPSATSCHQSNTRDCNWIRPDILEKLGIKKSDDTIIAGQEPDREWLTDPPKGYRVPFANAKASFEPAKHFADPGDQRNTLYTAPSE